MGSYAYAVFGGVNQVSVGKWGVDERREWEGGRREEGEEEGRKGEEEEGGKNQ